MMPQNYMRRKCKGGNKFTKRQEKINHLMYMDNITAASKVILIQKKLHEQENNN